MKGPASNAAMAVTDNAMVAIRTAKILGAGAGEDSRRSRSERA